MSKESKRRKSFGVVGIIIAIIMLIGALTFPTTRENYLGYSKTFGKGVYQTEDNSGVAALMTIGGTGISIFIGYHSIKLIRMKDEVEENKS
jgi:hypothetical protein